MFILHGVKKNSFILHGGTFTVELLSLGGQPEDKSGSNCSIPSRSKERWNYRADRRCHKINACNSSKNNLPSILYTTRNIAVPDYLFDNFPAI